MIFFVKTYKVTVKSEIGEVHIKKWMGFDNFAEGVA